MEEYKRENLDAENIQKEIPQKDRTVSRGVQSVIGVAVLTATLLTLWNPRSFFRTPNFEDLFQAAAVEEEAAQLVSEQPIRIGILSGHWQDKPGNVCSDGRTEHDVNYGIAYLLQIQLEGEGYQVDLFPEFDEGLFGYEADALIAIYSGSCEENPLPPSGFRIGTSLSTENLDAIDKLSTCMAEAYQSQTQLPFAFHVIDPDHASYHIFRDISANTPAIRFEVGALSTDGDLIFNQSGAIVKGIADGIACYLASVQDGG